MTRRKVVISFMIFFSSLCRWHLLYVKFAMRLQSISPRFFPLNPLATL